MLGLGGLVLALSACASRTGESLSDLIHYPERYQGKTVQVRGVPKLAVYGTGDGVNHSIRILLAPGYNGLECYANGPFPEKYKDLQRRVAAEISDKDDEPVIVRGVMKGKELEMHSLEVEGYKVDLRN